MQVLLEDHVRYDTSVLWKLHDAYYERAGISAWDEAIPSSATSNYAVARQHAWMMLVMAQSRSDPEAPFTVLELGSGAGRCAANVLAALAHDCGAEGRHLLERIRYLLSDFAPSVARQACAHPRLAHHVAEGRVIPAWMDIAQPARPRALERSGEGDDTTVGEPLEGPIDLVVANYVACVTRTRQFQCDRGHWRELWMRLVMEVALPEGDMTPPTSEAMWALCHERLLDPDFFKEQLTPRLSWTPLEGELMEAFEDPRHAQVLARTVEGLEQATLSYPVGFMELVLDLGQHLGQPEGCPLLITDFGHVDRREHTGLKRPNQKMYGNTLNHGVAFILWDAVAQLQGGFCVRTHDMLAAAHKALLIPPTVADAQRSTWIQAFEALHADQDPGQDLLDFQLAAQALERLDRPRDAARFWRRCLGIEPRRPDIHVYMARACIEAHLSAPAMDSLVEGTKTIAMSEQEWLDDVDFDYELGRTYVLEGDLDQAIAHYRRSLDREPKPSTWLRVAWLQLARGRFAPAFAAARSAQALKPDHAEAAEVLAEIKEAWWKQTTASLEAAHHPQAEAAVFKEPLPLDDEAEEA